MSGKKPPLFGPAVRMAVLLLILCGVLYPLAVVGVGQAVFPHQANGSLIVRHGQIIGSRLIGQNVVGPEWFWGRPSGTAGGPYNAADSGGPNLGPTNRALLAAILSAEKRLTRYQPHLNPRTIPQNLVTASASGLDPDITPAAARIQVPRVSRYSHVPAAVLFQLINRLTRPPALGLFGHARVNVLELNLAVLAWEQAHRP
jgi:K+-transporting ATPase ATPase C chain